MILIVLLEDRILFGIYESPMYSDKIGLNVRFFYTIDHENV